MPLTLVRIREAITISDPGGMRFLQATRTVLAIVIILGVFWQSDGDIRLFAALSTGFMLQCAEGRSKIERQRTLIISGLLMTLAVGLGSGLETHDVWQAFLVTCVAYLAYYLRQFVPQQAPIPVLGFILFLLSTVIPGGWSHCLLRMFAMLCGLAVSWIMHAWVLPTDRVQIFERTLRILCLSAAGELREIAAKGSSGRHAATMDELLTFSQALIDTLVDGELDSGLQLLLYQVYDTRQALWLLKQATRQSITDLNRDRLNHLAAQYETLSTGRAWHPDSSDSERDSRQKSGLEVDQSTPDLRSPTSQPEPAAPFRPVLDQMNQQNQNEPSVHPDAGLDHTQSLMQIMLQPGFEHMVLADFAIERLQRYHDRLAGSLHAWQGKWHE